MLRIKLKTESGAGFLGFVGWMLGSTAVNYHTKAINIKYQIFLDVEKVMITRKPSRLNHFVRGVSEKFQD